MIVRVALLAAAILGGWSASGGATLDRARLRPVFTEDFARAPDLWNATTNPRGRWKTNYWFGVQPTRAEKGWEPRTLVPNGELQYYGDPAEGMSAFEWQPGTLTIAARPNPFRADPVTHHLPYLSGLITTERSFHFTYGYVEARVAIPPGKGIWPAFWLLPVPAVKGGKQQQPAPIEIDVFESIGEPGKLHFTWFPNLPNQQKKGDGMAWDSGTDLSRFHDYGMMVTPKELIWYFDDREVRRVPNRDYHQPLYLLLNLAIGGNWPGAPAADQKWPARMRIARVRGYRLAGR